MGTTIVLLEWAGTFFLAVEAIKLHNLAILREKLRFLATLFSSVSAVSTIAPKHAKQLTMIMISLWTIFGWSFFILIGKMFELPEGYGFHIVASVIPSFPYSRLIAYLTILLAAPLFGLAVGYVLFKIFLRVTGVIVWALVILENNTANGIVGIMGFILFSVAAIMKLNGVAH